MALTKVTYSMIESAPINVIDYGADPTGVEDSTAAIQNAIDYAISLSVGGFESSVGVYLPNGTYKTSNTISIVEYNKPITLFSDGIAIISYTGSGTAIKVGAATGYGIYPIVVKNLSIERTGNYGSSIGLHVQQSSNGYYENISIKGFYIGLFNDGSINTLYDFKRKRISDCAFGIIADSSANPTGLRFTSNLATFRNIYIAAQHSGFSLQRGSGVSPNGSGGLVKLEYCTFEGMADTATESIYIGDSGEVPTYDQVVIEHCWFEHYGITLATIQEARVRFQNCFISGGITNIVNAINDNVWVTFNDCFGYFLDSAPSSGCLVTLSGTATDNVLGRIQVNNCSFDGLSKIHATYPNSTAGITTRTPCTYTIDYNASYPAGNNDYNHSLTINIIDEIIKIYGYGWREVDVVYNGSKGPSAYGLAILKVTRQYTGYRTTEMVSLTNYTLANTTASNASITFPATGDYWYLMQGYYTVVA